MARQLDRVGSRRGAPMGRGSFGPDEGAPLPPRLRIRRIRIDAGGYDDGGAYWGLGAPLWQLRGGSGPSEVCEFYRAPCKAAALAEGRTLYPAIPTN